jgi:hypothetical protein
MSEAKKSKTVKFSKNYNLKMKVCEIGTSSTKKYRHKKIKEAYVELSNNLGFDKSFSQTSTTQISVINKEYFSIKSNIRSELYYDGFFFNVFIKNDEVILNHNSKEVTLEELKQSYYTWEFKTLKSIVKNIENDFCSMDDYIKYSRNDYISLIESYIT